MIRVGQFGVMSPAIEVCREGREVEGGQYYLNEREAAERIVEWIDTEDHQQFVTDDIEVLQIDAPGSPVIVVQGWGRGGNASTFLVLGMTWRRPMERWT